MGRLMMKLAATLAIVLVVAAASAGTVYHLYTGTVCVHFQTWYSDRSILETWLLSLPDGCSYKGEQVPTSTIH